MAESSSKPGPGESSYLSGAGVAALLGIDGRNLYKLPDLPPAYAWVEGSGGRVTPLWERGEIVAYAESAAYLERKRFTPAKYR